MSAQTQGTDEFKSAERAKFKERIKVQLLLLMPCCFIIALAVYVVVA